MKSLIVSKKGFISAVIIALLFLFVSEEGYAQSDCKDIYNSQLDYFNKGQYENINNYLGGCIKDIYGNPNYYKGGGLEITYRVFKLCIESYRRLDQGGMAERKINELVSYLGQNRDAVVSRLNSTSLDKL
jgi:hypothetical protein